MIFLQRIICRSNFYPDINRKKLFIHVLNIIFLSAKTGEGDIRKGLDLGADAYITKPYSIKKLTEKIEELLN